MVWESPRPPVCVVCVVWDKMVLWTTESWSTPSGQKMKPRFAMLWLAITPP